MNVSSVSGRIASPFLGAYAASKFALEALSDSLRVELLPWGLAVVLVEPGPVATPIWGKGEAMAEEDRAGLGERSPYARIWRGCAGRSAKGRRGGSRRRRWRR
ncbi:MAG: SDR family NAD(P)-dependent oxidoreductase [Chloroflexia bacterium]